jgi:hypothetical protein
MPIDLLIVEGNLDSEILAAVFQGSPAVRRGGPKNSLKPQARYERERNGVEAGYVRDRDFDYEPPDDCSVVVVDSMINNLPLGWHWARHEIENYLLDPGIIESAIGITERDWSQLITDVAGQIRWYQIARWTIGQVRRSLPPHYELETRPAGIKNELQLPDSTDEPNSREWCLASIREFAARFEGYTFSDNIEANLDGRSRAISEKCLSDAASALIGCSGKDLLAGLPADVLDHAGFGNAGELRAALRDWVRANAKEAIDHFPEWQSLLKQVRE